MSQQDNLSGKLIVLEGIDGSGTTTQTGRLVNFLRCRGYEVLSTCEPGTPHNNQCRRLRREIFEEFHRVSPLTQLLLFWADRSIHFKKVVAPALEQGKIVICDRSHPSTYAYQVFQAKGLEREFLEQFFFNHDVNIRGGIVPDLVVFLDVAPQIACQRSQRKGEDAGKIVGVESNPEVQQQLQVAYRHLASLGRGFLELYGICKKWVTIDGNPAPDAVFTAVWKEAAKLLGIKKGGENNG